MAFGSETPGSSTTIRSVPCVVITRLGDAGRVDPVLDDLADDLEVLGPRDLVADLLRLVLDAEAALEVESELRLDRALPSAAGCRARGGRERSR